MDVGPIPWTAVNDYARRYGTTDDEMEELWLCIQRLELVQREYTDSKRKQHTAKAKAKKR